MRAPVVVLSLLALVACSPRPPAPADASPDLTSATAFVDSFLTSLAHPESPSTTARFDSVGFVWARSGALLSADSLMALLQAQRAAGKAIVLGTNDVHLTPLGSRAVVWSGIVSGMVKDSSGAERAIRGALTLVLLRQGTAWVIAAGHESVRPFDDAHEAAAAPR